MPTTARFRAYTNKATRKNRDNVSGVLHKDGWKVISISGSPQERGYQHGQLLHKELNHVVSTLPFLVKIDFHTTLDEYVDRCSRLMHDIIQTKYPEYYAELDGICKGALSRGVRISIPFLIAWNAYLSMSGEYKSEPGTAKEHTSGTVPERKLSAGETPKAFRTENPHTARCSAFIATGNATEKGDIVMAHNTHCNYALAPLSNIIIYCYPDKGSSFCMQTCAGLLCSSMDWFLCSNGMVGCETTISQIKYKPKFGTPYFCRIRDCMQYGNSLNEYADIMLKNNSGDYACSWLFGDTRAGEIMLCEIGLRHHNIQKTKNGVFYGMNSAIDNSLRTLETNDTAIEDIQTSSGSRNARLDYLLNTKYAGKINISNAKRVLADHYDLYVNRYNRGVRTICKHTDLAGDSFLKKPYYPHGAIDGKVLNTQTALKMEFYGKFGSSCNRVFNKREYLAKHPEYAIWKKYLHDLPNRPWIRIRPFS
jgi:hypothetical protein